jgi:hypothetical protein
MKEGERLVWAAAFAHGLAGIDFSATSVDDHAVAEQMAKAVANAHGAVITMRSMATASAKFPNCHDPCWTVLRDMAGLTH